MKALIMSGSWRGYPRTCYCSINSNSDRKPVPQSKTASGKRVMWSTSHKFTGAWKTSWKV